MACVVEGCKSHITRKENTTEFVSFHRFPKEEIIKNEWTRWLARHNWTPKIRSLCSNHFTSESFVPNESVRWRRLKANAVHTLYLPDETNSVHKNSTAMKKKRTKTERQNHCHICNKNISGSSYKLKAHLYRHQAVQPRFKCTYCSMEFFRTDIFTRHVNKHTGADINKKMYICDHCDRSFVNKHNLMRHFKIHDDNTAFTYKCMACGVGYCEERLLRYHIRKTHFNLHGNISTPLKKDLNEKWVEKVKESEVYVQMTKVNNNVLKIKKFSTEKNDNKKLDKCDVTEKEGTLGFIKNISTVKNDIIKPGNNDVKIEEVEKSPDFIHKKFKEYLKSVFAHNDKSQYSKATCDYCKKEMLKKSLLSHIRERHLKLRKFKCEDCKASFSRHYQLVNHACGKPARETSRSITNVTTSPLSVCCSLDDALDDLKAGLGEH